MRVLDLGCGYGLTPQKLNLTPSWQIIGLDIKLAAVAEAHINFPHRAFVLSAAEKLPFPASTFDRVISNVALPYMEIAKTPRRDQPRLGSWRDIVRLFIFSSDWMGTGLAVRNLLLHHWNGLPWGRFCGRTAVAMRRSQSGAPRTRNSQA